MTIVTALDHLPAPPCAQLLGWRMLHARPADGWIRIGFEARPEFCNPAGFIQGGFLAAMLDDTMGPAIFTHTGGSLYSATIEMNVQYLAPARVGPIIGEGQVVQLGKSVGFVEARLLDEHEMCLARATSSVRLVTAERALNGHTLETHPN
jgi:uncharacterized protein (TIGR00369 family)